jgi:hypothetical protein
MSIASGRRPVGDEDGLVRRHRARGKDRAPPSPTVSRRISSSSARWCRAGCEPPAGTPRSRTSPGELRSALSVEPHGRRPRLRPARLERRTGQRLPPRDTRTTNNRTALGRRTSARGRSDVRHESVPPGLEIEGRLIVLHVGILRWTTRPGQHLPAPVAIFIAHPCRWQPRIAPIRAKTGPPDLSPKLSSSRFV